eukprot:8415502-Pyramimonas_sp.AAC.1
MPTTTATPTPKTPTQTTPTTPTTPTPTPTPARMLPRERLGGAPRLAGVQSFFATSPPRGRPALG